MDEIKEQMIGKRLSDLVTGSKAAKGFSLDRKDMGIDEHEEVQERLRKASEWVKKDAAEKVEGSREAWECDYKTHLTEELTHTLRPCPFCRRRFKVKVLTDTGTWWKYPVEVRCDNCGYSGTYDTDMLAYRLNNRQSDSVKNSVYRKMLAAEVAIAGLKDAGETVPASLFARQALLNEILDELDGLNRPCPDDDEVEEE